MSNNINNVSQIGRLIIRAIPVFMAHFIRKVSTVFINLPSQNIEKTPHKIHLIGNQTNN